MYVPEHFAKTDLPLLHEFMRAYSFATLVTQHHGAPFASHLQVMLDAGKGAHGALTGHIARNNPQFEDFAAGGDVMAIFHGPHAYVSPAWYEPGPLVVPTWDYAVVHAYGRARALSEDELVQTLRRQVETNERERAAPWKLELTAATHGRMLAAIGGFEIVLDRLEGKFKLSQNRPEQDRRNVIAQLSQSEEGRDMARWMNRELELERN